MKIYPSVFDASWGSRIWTSLLVIIAFLFGIRWQQRAPIEADSARPPTVAQAESIPVITGPAAIMTGPDIVAVVPDFTPIEALMVGSSELIIHHRPVFIELARALSRNHIPMVALVSDARHKGLCEDALAEADVPPDSVYPVIFPLNTMWLRDFGPIFVRNNDHSFGILDVDYSINQDAGENRWRDDELPIVISGVMDLPLTSVPLRMAGGNLLSNGEGLILTSTDLIIGNRSRGYTVRKLAEQLRRFFAAGQWVYVKPAAGELTGHVDMIITLLEPDLVVVAQADASIDLQNVAILDEAAAFLASIHTSSGPMRVERIPLPPARDGKFRSYNNVIIANNLILVPVFSDVDPALQQDALDVFQRLAPEKKVVPIPADSLVDDNGLLRCISLGIPQGMLWKHMLYRDLGSEDLK